MHKFYLLLLLSIFTVFSSYCQNVIWNFGTSASSATPSTNNASNVAVSALARGNNNDGTTTEGFLNTTSASSGYSGASGTYNAGAAARVGSLSTGASGSAYYEFTLTPDASYTVQLTGISFGTRSTGTGPTAYSVRSSLDAFATSIVTGNITANSTWALKTTSNLTTTSAAGTSITFRIYGYAGTGNASAGTNNWRIDDLALTLVTSSSTATVITLNSTNFNGAFGNVNVGASSASSSFTVSGSNLTNDITITPPSGGFEIRTGTNPFSTTSITLTQTSGSVATTTIDARFTPTTAGAQSGNITASSTGATDKTVAVSGTGIQPTKLAITAISPASPIVNNNFSVTVQSQNASGTATNVLTATDFSISVNTGSGTLGGTVTGTIAAGANQAVITGVTYNTAETGVVLTASRTAGDVLTSGNSTAFNVVGVASQLAFVNFPASGSANSNIATFTVEARRADNSVDANYTGNIALSLASGTGNLTGTLTKAAVAGVATFNDIKFDAAGTYTLTASSSGLTAVTSSVITIGAAPVAPAPGELLINQLSPGYSGSSDEYIELVNVTNKALDLSSVAIKYQSAAGGAGTSGGNLSGTLAPYGYWLVSPNSPITIGQTVALVPDGSFNAGFSSSGGQVGIIRISDNVKIDALGYGGSTGAYTEGTSASFSSGAVALKRIVEGVDNNNNSTDFATVTAANIDLKNSTSRIANANATIGAGSYNRIYVTGNSSLSGSVTLTGKLVLNSGYLTTTSANTLKLATTATVTGGSNSSFVDGPITGATAGTTAKLLPIGKAGVYKPVTVTPTTSDASEYTAEYFATSAPTAPLESRLSAIQTNEYWLVDRTSGTAPATVTLNYNSATATWSNSTNPTSTDVITVVHLRSSTNTWNAENGPSIPGTTTSATLTSGTINSFSPFTFGYGASVVLPVTLTSFTATKTAAGNLLSWNVTSETNFSHYVVERSNDRNNNFNAVATVTASNRSNYSFTDAQTTGYNYYRLKLVDRDGKSTYSKTILIINQAKGFEVTNVYPTLTTGTVLMESYAAAPVKATVRVLNQNGQTVYTQSVVLTQATITNVNLSQLATGNYLLQVLAEGYNKTVRLIKQ